MNFRARVRRAILSLDEALASGGLAVLREGGRLLCFLFHGLFKNDEEIQAGVMDPQQGITVEMFRAFIRHFREQRYRFVSPGEILAGLDRAGKHILITFDDGYFNNARALPVLEEFDVPAVIFISTNHIKQGKAFWWDAAFREGKKRRQTDAEIRRAVAGYKRFKTETAERMLRREHGEGVLNPVGDMDRPFTPGELRLFAAHRLVHLGNHTKDHAILTNYSPAEVSDQIAGAQDAIREMTGKMPEMISYPCGKDSPAIRAAARQEGLQLGVVTRAGKNRLPLAREAKEAMALKRFTLWGDRAVEAQCRASRSHISFRRLLTAS